MILSSLNKHREFGLLLLRVAVGALLVAAAFPVVAGGAGRWRAAAAPAAHFLHIGSHLEFLGAVVAFSELAAGILLFIGLFFRVVCLVLAIVLTVSAFIHAGHHLGAVFAVAVCAPLLASYSLVLLGPGKYSFDKS